MVWTVFWWLVTDASLLCFHIKRSLLCCVGGFGFRKEKIVWPIGDGVPGGIYVQCFAILLILSVATIHIQLLGSNNKCALLVKHGEHTAL